MLLVATSIFLILNPFLRLRTALVSAVISVAIEEMTNAVSVPFISAVNRNSQQVHEMN